MRKTGWYNSRMLVVLLLVLFWPIGLYGLWRSYRFSWLAKLLLTAVPLLFLAIIARSGVKGPSTQPSAPK